MTIDHDELIEALEQLAQYGIPSETTVRLIDVGSREFLQFFEKELFEDLLENQGSTCRIFEGAYGSGKTHLLQLLRRSALNRGMVVVWTDLSQTLGLEDWRLLVQHVLQTMEIRLEGVAYRSLPRIVEALGSIRGTNPKLAGLPHPGFGKGVAIASQGGPGNPEGKELLSRFLQGERVTVGDLKHFGISGVKDPLSTRNAEHALATITTALLQLGARGTLLLFDENEKTLAFKRSTPPKRVMVGANLLRRLIDNTVTGKISGALAVFAVLPGFIESCALAYPALGQRLQVTRDISDTPGWRTPVLSVEHAIGSSDPEVFLESVIDQFSALAAGHANGLRKDLLSAGEQVIQGNVSSGYKRQLMKELATITVEAIQAAEE